MTIQTIKFSQFATGGDLTAGDITAGLLSGANTIFTNPWTFLAPGSTADRPIPSPAIDGRLRFNTDTLVYEYYDTLTSMWVELSGSGSGTVNPGVVNDLAYYASNGTVISPINAAADAILVTNGSSVPSLSTTLPSGLTIPGATISGATIISSTAALSSGSIVATPVNPDDLVNKAYVDAAVGGDVTSITGTTNQIIASNPTGAVTLSLPQNIDHGANVQFGTVQFNSGPSAIRDSNGNTVLAITATTNAQNYLTLINAISGNYPILLASGVDPNIALEFQATGGAQFSFYTTATSPVSFASGPSRQHTAAFAFATGATSQTITFLDTNQTVVATSAALTNGQLAIGNTGNLPTAATLTQGTGITITNAAGSITIAASGALAGTYDADSGTAAPSAGVLTISGSSTGLTTTGTASTIGLTGTLALGHGGTSAALTASNGGIFYSTASAGAILAGTATANQVLLSGASTTPAWSTATYPATTTINQLLYSSSANTIAGITVANNGVLITSNSGVPSWLANSGTPGFVLTANSGAPPSWQAITAEGAVTSLTGDAGSAMPNAGAVIVSGGTTGLTTSGTSHTLSLTGTLVVGNGGTGVTSVTIAPTATAFAGWDSNKNLTANNLIDSYTTTVSSATPIVLTVSSTYLQFITGSTAQTVTMPVANTLVTGQSYRIVNDSSNTVTINSSGGNLIESLPASSEAILTCILASGTSAASWYSDFTAAVAGVSSITGTANEIIASASTGAVTLSAPQSLATTAAFQVNTVQFNSNNGLLDSNGKQMLAFSPAGSLAVNYFTMVNSVATSPVEFAATGSDTNIQMNISSKGTGNINFYSANFGANLLQLTPVASAVNYLVIGSAIAGNNVLIEAQGTDTNVNLEFLVKAAGEYIFYSDSNTPFVFFSGTSYQHESIFSFANTSATRTITWPDSSGTVTLLGNTTTGSGSTLVLQESPTFQDTNGNNILTFTTAATSVNNVYISNAATGGPPSIGVTGTDPNIGLSFYVKATSNFNFPSTTLANYVTIVPAATTTSPMVGVGGTDNNILLEITGKGTGGAALQGQTGGSGAAAGYVGELITATATTGNLTSGAATNITSISVTAGIWDIWGNTFSNPAATTTQTAIAASVNTSSGTFATIFNRVGTLGTANTSAGINAPMITVNLSSTTTYYLNGAVTFAVSTCTQTGTIYARRRA